MLFQILFVFILIYVIVYLKGRYNETYWKRRGVKFHQKNKNLGPILDFMIDDRPFFEHLLKIYKENPEEPAVGLGSLLNPNLYVLDPTNIQSVLATDFLSFNDRGLNASPDDLLAQNLFTSNGRKWKLLRQNMTPLFTSAKLRSMYYIMDKSAQDYVTYLRENPLPKGNMFASLSNFCCAAVSATVFGITSESIFDSPFLKLAQRIFRPSFFLSLRFAISNIASPVLRVFNIKVFKEFEGFFIGAIKQVIRQREKEKVRKHDFADICVSLQQHGTLKDAETGFELEPTDELLAAQGFFFFIAGVEPTASAMHATLFELGRNPDLLKVVHDEIDDAFDKNDKMSFEVINDMKQLDMVLSEAIRLHPPVAFLLRRCIKNTVLPVGNIKVDEGTTIFIPIFEIHHDDRYYPAAETFDPARFAKDTKVADMAYMPFGRGNRICIGLRYAYLQAKSGIVHLLRNYTVKTTVLAGGVKYKKTPAAVRIDNIELELIERGNKKVL